GLFIDLRALFTSPTISALAAAAGSQAGEVEVPPNLIPPHCPAVTPEMLPLIKLSQPEIDRIVSSVPGGAANVQDIYPLAPLQEGIFFHHLLNTQGDAYLLSSLFAFDSRVRLDGFLNALQKVVDRHDILRTAVVWQNLKEAVQVVWRRAPLIVEEVELDPAGKDAVEELYQRFDPRRTRIDLGRAPLLRGHVARDPRGDRWLLLLLEHHLVGDLTTMDIIQREMEIHLSGGSGPLPEPPPFRNFVAQARLGMSQEEHRKFFEQMLAEVDEPTIPFGLLDVQGDGRGIGEAQLAVDADLAGRIRERARVLHVSAAGLCHLAYALVLARISGRTDVVFGTVLFGRLLGGEGIDRVVGMFINTLPIRIAVGEKSAEESVRRTHALLMELMRHEHASLVLAQRCSGVSAPRPLFSALLNYRYARNAAQTSSAEITRESRGIERLRSEERTNYPCTLSIDDLGQGFVLTAQIQNPIEPLRVCRYMQRALEQLIAALERAPETAVGRLEVLPEAEVGRMIEEFNRTEAAYPADRRVHELFEEQVRLRPEAVALAAGDQVLTYGSLNRRANRLARRLREAGVGPETLVGICLDRSPELL
ncbi:MAG: non-ribosomal peptide synthetase, partial [Planctomycetaceae bacterium]